jgi:6-pyruvoyltetrahydropterin/6-carboxytetrahydropterin synthase
MGPTSVAPDEIYKLKPLAKWIISKDFNFCYGHRVFSQELNPEYSLDSACKCRHLHGHEGLIRISLEARQLNNGMVTDFKHLNWLKKWLDDELDHKFIMGLDDPLLFHEAPLVSDISLSRHEAGHYTLNPSSYSDLEIPLREKYEGMVFVKFVPTSENLSKWLFEYIDKKMSKIGVKTLSVQFYETPKSQSIYTLI